MTGGDGSDDALQRLLDAAQLDVAGERRRRARREADLAFAETTLVGALRELADQQAHARLELASGPVVTGRIRAVGRDLVVVGVDEAVTLVAMRAIVLLEVLRAGPAPAGDRAASHDVHLVEVLSDLAAGGMAGAGIEVAVWVAGRASPVHGRLLAAGVDVLALRAGRRPSDDPPVTLPVAGVVAVRVA